MRFFQRSDQGRPRVGGATVELAFVAPMLVTLILGTIEMSRALHVKQIMSDACRGAGRLAIQPNKTVAEVQACAQKILEYNGIKPEAVTVTINGKTTTDLSAAREGDEIGVTVTLKASSVGFVMPYFLPADAQLTSTIVMRRQK